MQVQRYMETDNTKKFNELFDELEDYNEEEQKQKILKLNELIEEMDKGEFYYVFARELFDRIKIMIEDVKLSMGNTILMLKHVGYCVVLKFMHIWIFAESSLNERFEKMIVEEQKKEKINEKLLIDLCECYLFLCIYFSPQLLSICVPCLLRFVSNKEENEEAEEDVEMALLALSNIGQYKEMEQGLYLNEILEIIKHHQEHCNLTRLGFQSAWQFLINRLESGKELEVVIVNELHFAREVKRELVELSKFMDWTVQYEKKEKETKEELVLLKWFLTLDTFFDSCKLWNDECSGLIESVVQVFQLAKDNRREISNQCIFLFKRAVRSRSVEVNCLLKGGAVDAVLEVIQNQSLNNVVKFSCFEFFINISVRLEEKKEDKRKEEEDDEMDEVKRKLLKRKMFEKMEEEGYEDAVTSFREVFHLFKRRFM